MQVQLLRGWCVMSRCMALSGQCLVWAGAPMYGVHVHLEPRNRPCTSCFAFAATAVCAAVPWAAAPHIPCCNSPLLSLCSTINSLLNERVAPVTAFQQDTAKPTVYRWDGQAGRGELAAVRL